MYPCPQYFSIRSAGMRPAGIRQSGMRPTAFPLAALGLVSCLLALPAFAQNVDLNRPLNNGRPISARIDPGVRPADAEQARMRQEDLIHEVVEPELVLELDPTRSKLVRTRQPIWRVAIVDPQVLEVTQYAPNEFELVGRRSGETTLSLWYGPPGADAQVIRYLVRVRNDEGEQIRAEVEYGKLQQRVNEMFPNSQIQLIPLADKLIVRGQARDSEEASHIMGIIRGESINQSGDTIGPGSGTVARLPGARDLPTATVISMLNVPGEQQVMLKVRIAELTRTALRELGMDFSVIKDNISVSNFLTGGIGNVTAILDSGDVSLFIKAFSTNGNGKILAEPTLVTLSGRPATFLAGGEFAVPTTVGIQGVAAATTTFRGFGTQLTFTPTVIDKDRIRLIVAPSFSSLNTAATVNSIPGLNTRAVTTTVDLREGQWLAIAGLIQDQQGGSKHRIPGLGDVPVLGAIFGKTRIEREETELVVLVSPELVHPLEAEQVPPLLPGMAVTEPNDRTFFLHQQIEGTPDSHHRSTVWPTYYYRRYRANMDAIRATNRYAKGSPEFQMTQDYYVNGPHGFTR